MKLLLFKLQLAWHLGIFILTVSANVSNKTKPIILTSFIFLLGLLVFSISILTKTTQPEKIIVPAVRVPQVKEQYTYHQMTISELEETLTYWQKVAEKQPFSRDILLNLSQLYSALSNEELSEDYFQKAYAIDPNHPAVQ